MKSISYNRTWLTVAHPLPKVSPFVNLGEASLHTQTHRGTHRTQNVPGWWRVRRLGTCFDCSKRGKTALGNVVWSACGADRTA